MSITITAQSVEVTDIGSVQITDIVESEDEDQNTIYVREIRVYTSDVSPKLVFTLKLVGATENIVELQAPAQTF